KIHGYPEWFSELRKQKHKERIHVVQEETPLDVRADITTNSWNNEIASLVQQEVIKYMKNQNLNNVESAGCVGYAGMSGMNLINCSFKALHDVGIWVVDTGATSHMCHDFSLFTKITKLQNPIPVYLPDGSIKHATHRGIIKLNPNLVLH